MDQTTARDFRHRTTRLEFVRLERVLVAKAAARPGESARQQLRVPLANHDVYAVKQKSSRQSRRRKQSQDRSRARFLVDQSTKSRAATQGSNERAINNKRSKASGESDQC